MAALAQVHLGKLLCMVRMRTTFSDWRRKNPARFVEVFFFFFINLQPRVE